MTERGRIGRPPKVNREQVVAAAADILTTDGPLKFSMRTLAARLDISAMGIYHYFDSKNDLLGAVLEHQSWNTPVPELAEDPHERLVQLPLIVIDHLTRHPWVIDVLSADEIIDLVQGGQGVFGIAVGRVWREVEGSLAELPSERFGDEAPAEHPGDELSARRRAKLA